MGAVSAPSKLSIQLAGRAFLSRSPLYIGATTNLANFGDALLLTAHEELLGTRMAVLPLGGNDRLLRLRGLLRRPMPTALLGGGTLVGRPSYRRALESFSAAHPAAPITTLGVGVSAPAPSGKSSPEELRAWCAVLGRLANVRVRGPRSHAHLLQIGIRSEVVGDPVLALFDDLGPEARELTRRSRRHMIVNLGNTGAEVATASHLSMAVAELHRRCGGDLRVSIAVASPYDLPAASLMATNCRDRGVIAELTKLWPMTPAAARTFLGSADIVIAERLHAMIASVATGTATLMLAYEDKCWDFAESVNGQRWCTDVTSPNVEWLAEQSWALIEDPATQLTTTRPAVRQLRDRLAAAAQSCRIELDYGLRLE